MGGESIELNVRVIVVTTRAALAHAVNDPALRRAIIARGHQLIDSLERERSGTDGAVVAQARADLDALLHDGG